jgi:hypothetical protein
MQEFIIKAKKYTSNGFQTENIGNSRIKYSFDVSDVVSYLNLENYSRFNIFQSSKINTDNSPLMLGYIDGLAVRSIL